MNALQATMQGFNAGFGFVDGIKKERKANRYQNALASSLGGGGGMPAASVAAGPSASPSPTNALASSMGVQGATAPSAAQGRPNYGAAAQTAFQNGQFDQGMKFQGFADKYAANSAAQQAAQQKEGKKGLEQLYRMGQAVLDPQSGVSLDMVKQQLAGSMDQAQLDQITDQNLPQYMAMLQAQLGGQTQILKNNEAVYDPLHGKMVASNRGFTAEQAGDQLYGFDTATGKFNNPVKRDQTYEETETGRANLAQEDLENFGNATDRIEANTNRMEVESDIAGGSSGLSYGKTPVYGVDESGKTVAGVIGNNGSFKPLNTGGIDILSPFEKSMQSQQGRSQGKTRGETSANLPAIENNANRALKTVEQLLNHKGINAGTGLSAKIPAMPGSDKYAFNVANKQAQGQVFLQGFEALKGGGVITEVEGLKAEQALARMDAAQSQEDYKAGLRDYREVIENGMVSAYEKAGLAVPDKYQKSSQAKNENKKLYDKYGLE